MRIYKPTYTDRKGQTKNAAKWYVEFRHLDVVHRVPAFKDKQASALLGGKIERLIACKDNGDPPTADLLVWIRDMPAALRTRLGELGLIDDRRMSTTRPLAEHLTDFEAAIRARGTTEGHAKLTTLRVRTLFERCGFKSFADITGSVVQRKLKELRDAKVKPLSGTEGAFTRAGKKKHEKGQYDHRAITLQTSNYYLGAAKQFCRWMVRERRALESPLEHVQPLNARVDARLGRRALTVEEQRKLIAATEAGPVRFDMTGPERAMLYQLALETGLRAGELRSLRRDSFRLDQHPPTVTVAAAYSKRRRTDTLYLKVDTAKALERFLRSLLPAAQVFRMPHPIHLVEMLREDLVAPDIKDNEEGVIDFHALRHSFITTLVRAGVDPRTVQALARHSTITLTMDRYCHSGRTDQASATERLPNLSAAQLTQLRPTGTEGEKASRTPRQSPSSTGVRTSMRSATRCRASTCVLEAAPGLEPGITDLQSVALPLGYAARMRALEDTGTCASVKEERGFDAGASNQGSPHSAR